MQLPPSEITDQSFGKVGDSTVDKGSRVILLEGDFDPIDVTQVPTGHSFGIGVGTVGLWIFQSLNPSGELTRHRLNGIRRQAINESIIGRMADPDSRTYRFKTVGRSV